MKPHLYVPLIPLGPKDIGDGVMALRAERDEVVLDILVAKPVIGRMVDLKPVATSIVMAGTAAVTVQSKPLLSFCRPVWGSHVFLVTHVH